MTGDSYSVVVWSAPTNRIGPEEYTGVVLAVQKAQDEVWVSSKVDNQSRRATSTLTMGTSGSAALYTYKLLLRRP